MTPSPLSRTSQPLRCASARKPFAAAGSRRRGKGWTRRFSLLIAVLLFVAVAGGTATLPAAPFAEVAARDASLRSLTFVDAGHGFAVGDRGVVLRTDDGGRSWTRLETPTDATLYGVSFVDRQNGWAVGGSGKPFSDSTRGVVLRTRDAGANWQALPTDTLPLLRWTRFFDRKNGVAVGSGGAFHPSGVFVTGDGGRSWQPLPGDRPRHWRAADFFAPQLGFAVADRGAIGMLAKQQVRPIGAAEGDRRGFHAVTLVGPTGGWLVGDGGAVLKTTDSGRSWRPPGGAPPKATQAACDWRAVAARGDRVWIAGSPGSVVLHSQDGGRTWRRQATGVTTPLHAITFVDPQRGWAAGALGTLLATDNGGRTWRVQRRGGERLALDVLIADRRDAPAELIAKQGAAEGYLASIGLMFGEEEAEKLATDAARLTAATVSAGGAGASTDWRLPLAADQRRLAAEPLLAELNRKTDGKAWDELQTALIARIRSLRPTAIALIAPEGSASPGAAELLNRAVEEAVARSADPSAVPQLAELGLGAWRVDRVVELTPDALRSNGGFSTGDFEPLLGTSIAEWSSAAGRLVVDAYRPPPSRVGWRVLVGGSAAAASSGGRRADLLAGAQLVRGGEARRPAATPPAGNLDQLRTAAQKRRNLRQLLAQREGDDAWAGQVVNLTGGLDADSGATLLYQLAVGYRDAGKLDLAADTYYLLAKRYQDHALTEPALGWLLRYYASGEAAVHAAANAQDLRSPQPLANVPAGAKIDAVVPSGDRPGALTDDDRYQRATRLGAYLRDARPAVYADPAVRFGVAAAKRRLGYEKDAQRILLLMGKQAIDPAWRRAADAERWLAKPTELPPAKPIAVCKSVATRPNLDGRLGDACWRGAEPISLRSLRAPPPVATSEADAPRGVVVRLVRDEDFLYLAIDCPKALGVDYQAPAGRRPRDGDLMEHDRVTLRLDTDRDYTTALELTIDARGWPGDRLSLGNGWAAAGWDPKWYVAAEQDGASSQDGGRWRAEAAVPLSALASPAPTPRDVWAVAVTRHAPGGAAATATWTGAAPGTPDHFGLLLMK